MAPKTKEIAKLTKLTDQMRKYYQEAVVNCLGIPVKTLKGFPKYPSIKECEDCRGTGKIELFTSVVECEKCST